MTLQDRNILNVKPVSTTTNNWPGELSENFQRFSVYRDTKPVKSLMSEASVTFILNNIWLDE